MSRLGTLFLALAAVLTATAGAPAREPGWPPPIHDHQVFWFLLLDQLEYRAAEGPDVVAWDAQGWVGGDYHRIWIKSEGESETRSGAGGAWEGQVLYGRMVSPFWDLQAGVRHERVHGDGRNRSRSFAVLGAQGLAPYWLEVEPAVFLSDDGDLSFRLTAEYEVLLTKRVVLQPKLELDAALQEVRDFGVGRGLNTLEVGLRARYEIRPEVAPYLGIVWTRELADTADFARREGESVGSWSVVAGVRFWL